MEGTLILGTGTIARDGTGIAEFPVRGTLPLRWTLVEPKRDARLRVGPNECAMAWVYRSQDEDGVPRDWLWSGRIPVEGYWMDVEGQRDGQDLRLLFLDCRQPMGVP